VGGRQAFASDEFEAQVGQGDAASGLDFSYQANWHCRTPRRCAVWADGAEDASRVVILGVVLAAESDAAVRWRAFPTGWISGGRKDAQRPSPHSTVSAQQFKLDTCGLLAKARHDREFQRGISEACDEFIA